MKPYHGGEFKDGPSTAFVDPARWERGAALAVVVVLAVGMIGLLFTTVSFSRISERREASSAIERAWSDAKAATGSEQHTAEPTTDAKGRFEIPPGRPAWVDQPAVTTGAVHSFSIASEPFVTLDECEAHLNEKLERETTAFVNSLLDSPEAGEHMQFKADEIRQRFVRSGDTYNETLRFEFGVMQQQHVRVSFDDHARRGLVHQWHDIRAGHRLFDLGKIGGMVLTGMLALFGCLRLVHRVQRGGTTLPAQGAIAAPHRAGAAGGVGVVLLIVAMIGIALMGLVGMGAIWWYFLIQNRVLHVAPM